MSFLARCSGFGGQIFPSAFMRKAALWSNNFSFTIGTRLNCCLAISAGFGPKQTKFGAVERIGDRRLDSMSRLRDHRIPRSTAKERERT